MPTLNHSVPTLTCQQLLFLYIPSRALFASSMELLICNSQQHNVKAKDDHKQVDIFKVTRPQIFP